MAVRTENAPLLGAGLTTINVERDGDAEQKAGGYGVHLLRIRFLISMPANERGTMPQHCLYGRSFGCSFGSVSELG